MDSLPRRYLAAQNILSEGKGGPRPSLESTTCGEFKVLKIEATACDSRVIIIFPIDCQFFVVLIKVCIPEKRKLCRTRKSTT